MTAAETRGATVGTMVYCAVHGCEGWYRLLAVRPRDGYIKVSGVNTWNPPHNFSLTDRKGVGVVMKVLTVTVVGALLASPSFAGQRSGGSVPRAAAGPRVVAAPVVRAVPRVAYPVHVYGHRYYGAPYYYGAPAFWYGWPGFSFAWSGAGWGVGVGYPGYGYGVPGAHVAVSGGGGSAEGGIRLAVDQRDAAVFVDGYYAGTVDDFDGAFQALRLEPGPHRIEVRADGYEPAVVDVNSRPGQTVTYRAVLRRLP